MKARALRLLKEHRGQYSSLTAACVAVARQERIGAETLRRWAVQDQIDSGDRPGTTSEEHQQIRKLKAENARLREGCGDLESGNGFLRRRCPLSPKSLIISLVDSMPQQGYAAAFGLPGRAGGQGCQIAARSLRAWRTRQPSARAVSHAKVLHRIEELAFTIDTQGRRRLTPEGLYGHAARCWSQCVTLGLQPPPGRWTRRYGNEVSAGLTGAQRIRTTIPG